MKITKENMGDVFKSKKKDVAQAEKEGYIYLQNCFVDNSGFGDESEPAMTVAYFKRVIEGLVGEHKTIYTFITNAGQFQVNLGVYIKDKK